MMNPKKLYYILLGSLGLTAILIVLIFTFGNQRLQSKIAELRKLSGDVQLETEQINNLQQLEGEYRQIAPLAEKAQSILPSQKYQAEAVAQIAAIADRQNLPLSGLSFESTEGLPSERSQTLPAKIPGILIMPVGFETVGSYRQLQGLLKGLEKQERYMQVSALTLSRSEEDNSISINLSLEVFLKP